MKELQELQAYLNELIGATSLKEIKTEVEMKIVSGAPLFSVAVYKEKETYTEEFKASDITLERCKKRLSFEVEMFLSFPKKNK